MLKKVVCALWFVLPLLLNSQNIYVAKSANQAYAGIDNVLIVDIPGDSCSSLLVLTDNGEIRNHLDCSFIWRPTRVGGATLYLARLIDGDTVLLKERYSPTRPLPAPVPSLSSRRSGVIGLHEFRVQSGVSNFFIGVDICGSGVIDRFKVIALRDGQQLFHHEHQGARFSPKLKALFSELQAGDQVLFFSIYARWPGVQTPQLLQGMEFWLVE